MVVYYVSLVLAFGVSVVTAVRERLTWALLWKLPLSFIAVMAGFFAAYVLLVGILTLPVSLKERYTRQSGFFYGLLNLSYGYLCGLCGVQLHIGEMKELPEERFLVVSNHCSGFDHMLISMAMAKEKLAFITKPENLKIPVARRIAWRCCYIPIDREDARKALDSVNAAAELIRSGASSMGIFPEGTRSRTGEMGAFKNGSFKIAQKAGCAIVVAAVRGTDAIRRNLFRRTDVYVSVPEVIPAEEVKGVRTAQISTRVRDAIQRSLGGEKQPENG